MKAGTDFCTTSLRLGNIASSKIVQLTQIIIEKICVSCTIFDF